MTEEEEIRNWEDGVIEKLAPERDKLQAQLNKIRELRMNLGLSNRDKRREYLMKIGELSFIVGAAITPAVIVSGNKISFLSFALLGAGLYLLNGLFALWRCKTLLYQDAEDVPEVGLDQEIMLEPVAHSYNKILYSPSTKEYQDEYLTASKELLDQNSESQKQIWRASIDFWADLVLFGFMFATIIIARTIWPFTELNYWIVLTTFVVLAAFTLTFGYYKTREHRLKLEYKHEKLAENRLRYQDWHNREVLKK